MWSKSHLQKDFSRIWISDVSFVTHFVSFWPHFYKSCPQQYTRSACKVSYLVYHGVLKIVPQKTVNKDWKKKCFAE